jgi:hypothetical protein
MRLGGFGKTSFRRLSGGMWMGPDPPVQDSAWSGPVQMTSSHALAPLGDGHECPPSAMPNMCWNASTVAAPRTTYLAQWARCRQATKGSATRACGAASG